MIKKFICTYYKLLSPLFTVCLPFKVSFPWSPAGDRWSYRRSFEGGGLGRRMAIWREETYGRTQILKVVFVLSKLVINA
jgi:hypothetical protein